jgi:hypothetical protein
LILYCSIFGKAAGHFGFHSEAIYWALV